MVHNRTPHPTGATPPPPPIGPPLGYPPHLAFPEPALNPCRLRLTPSERRDKARLERIGRTPVLERTAADLAFEDAFQLGEAFPSAIGDAIEGVLAGLRAAERRAGYLSAGAFRVETAGLHPRTAATVRIALRRGAAQ